MCPGRDVWNSDERLEGKHWELLLFFKKPKLSYLGEYNLNIQSGVVRFEVFTAVTMMNGVFWDVTPCGSCKNRRFAITLRLHHQGDKNR
jgi:hypothetical protein